MTTSNLNLDIQAAWERSILAASRDDTALMLTVTARRPARTQTRDRAPIDLAFVLDRSGSMDGDKLDLVKRAVIEALAYLNPDDRVALVVFDNEIDVLQRFAPASGEVRDAIGHGLRTLEARGGTNLSGGWLTGCGQLAEHAPHPSAARLRRAILLTDGQANDGILDPGELARHATALRQRGISTSTMGVGEGFDEMLLSGLAEAGGGNFVYIEHPAELPAFFEHEIGGLTALAALRPQLEITLPLGTRGVLLNAFPNERHGKTITVELRDLVDGDRIELVMMVTHRGRVWGESATLGCTARYVDPESSDYRGFVVDVPPLTLVPDGEARHAPVDHAVAFARAREQARLDQREALRLDRAGRHAESRQMFAASHGRLHEVDAAAAAGGYAGIKAAAMEEMRTESSRAHSLASAPAAPLDERTHKERAARHARSSRGDRNPRS
ncbi:MAG: VWA domain-containing protein [Chloroflexia bacterium]|nr:VWA domain-containing protein [Chloroflexia bacterium]